MAKRDSTSPPLGDLNLDRVTTAERIADGICDLILRGEVAPGTTLKENQLREAIGVSRNTIREALRLLARDQLVTYHAYRGVSVAALSTADVDDLFRARRILEFRAVEELPSLTYDEFDTLLEALVAARKSREEHVAEANWHGAFEADMRFHAALVSVLDSEALDEFFTVLLRRLRLGFYVRGGLSTQERTRDTEQHRAIEKFVRERKLKQCRAAVEEHLRDSEELLLALMAEGGGQEEAAT